MKFFREGFPGFFIVVYKKLSVILKVCSCEMDNSYLIIEHITISDFGFTSKH